MAVKLKGKEQRKTAKGIIGSPEKEKKPPSFNKFTGGNTTKGKAGYSRMTEDEREDWKVAHGIAPTSEDPSAIGQASRAAAKAAHARGELSDKDRRDQGIIEVRELDEAKYNDMLEAARTARTNMSDTGRKKPQGSRIFSGREQERSPANTSAAVANIAGKIRGRNSRNKAKPSRLSSPGFEDRVFSADLMPNTGDGR